MTVSQPGAATLLTFHTRRGTRSIRLQKDPRVSAGTLEHAERLAIVGGRILLLATTYASQTGSGGPQAQCAAGEEAFVRAIRLGPRPTQTARITTMSCWTSVELAGPRWDAARRRLVFDGAEAAYVVTPAGRLNLIVAK
jgi:hypothetical protein